MLYRGVVPISFEMVLNGPLPVSWPLPLYCPREGCMTPLPRNLALIDDGIDYERRDGAMLNAVSTPRVIWETRTPARRLPEADAVEEAMRTIER